MPIPDNYIFPMSERMKRKEMPKRLRWVIKTKYGVLGYYSYDTNRHVRKSVLAFRCPAKAEKVAKVLKNRTGMAHSVEIRNEKFTGEGTREERRILGNTTPAITRVS